jgi:PAS domain S-box-containing protein
MTPDPILNDPAFPVMTMDILNNLLRRADNPVTLVKHLTEELRELTGARCILFTQCIGGLTRMFHRVVGVSPSRYGDWVASAPAVRLYEIVYDLPGTHLCQPDDSTELSGLLREAGFGLSVIVPLNVGRDRVGAMLVLGLLDEHHIETEIKLLDTLSTIVALVLRNAFLFENQEQMILERTRQLQKSQALLRAILDGTTDVVFVKDRIGRYILVNAEVARVFGRPVEEIVGRDDTSFFPPEEAEFLMTVDREIMAQPAVLTREEHVSTIEGKRTYLATKGPIHDEQGNVAGLFGISRDITERKQTEEALKESEMRLRFALEGSNDGLWDVQLKTGSVYISPRGCEMLGYRPNELDQVARVWSDLVHPDDLPQTKMLLQAHVQGRTPLFELEQRLRMKSGDWKWVLTRGKVVLSEQDGSPLRMTGTHTDISERRKLEEQLRQSQKMEAVGQLAGGIAHDFNNILQVIMGYSNVLMADPVLEERLQEKVGKIIAASEKAAQLTKGMLAFSRKQVMAPRQINLNVIVQHVQQFLIRIIGEDIQFKLTLNELNLPVYIDSGQIEQVLVNLATNARDAMPKGGALTIETGLQEIDAPLKHEHAHGKPGHYAWVAVSDTGCGMGEETRTRIFEPFFTTKEVGKGTGLGMAIVYGIVQQHNGFISVYSEPGHGSTFRIFLPIVEPEQSSHEEKTTQNLPRRGYETILLAEDDVTVRELVVSVLTSFGYDVIQAENGEEAVEKFAANRSRIRLILLDMIMPKKNGDKAYEEICRLQPGVRALYMSGYTADFIQNRGVSEAGVELIMKPVQPLELLRKVRELLDA